MTGLLAALVVVAGGIWRGSGKLVRPGQTR